MELDNFDKYSEYTGKGDWKAICDLNNVSFDTLGLRKKLKVLSDYLESGEVVFALSFGITTQTKTSNASDFGSNTWLVVSD